MNETVDFLRAEIISLKTANNNLTSKYQSQPPTKTISAAVIGDKKSTNLTEYIPDAVLVSVLKPHSKKHYYQRYYSQWQRS